MTAVRLCNNDFLSLSSPHRFTLTSLRVADLPSLFHLPVPSIRISTHCHVPSKKPGAAVAVGPSHNSGGLVRNWKTRLDLPIERQLTASRQQLEKPQPTRQPKQNKQKTPASVPSVATKTPPLIIQAPATRSQTPEFHDSLLRMLGESRNPDSHRAGSVNPSNRIQPISNMQGKVAVETRNLLVCFF